MGEYVANLVGAQSRQHRHRNASEGHNCKEGYRPVRHILREEGDLVVRFDPEVAEQFGELRAFFGYIFVAIGLVSAEKVKCRTFRIFLRRVLVEFGQGFEFVHIVLFEDIEFFAYLDEGLHAAVELAAVVRG